MANSRKSTQAGDLPDSIRERVRERLLEIRKKFLPDKFLSRKRR